MLQVGVFRQFLNYVKKRTISQYHIQLSSEKKEIEPKNDPSIESSFRQSIWRGFRNLQKTLEMAANLAPLKENHWSPELTYTLKTIWAAGITQKRRNSKIEVKQQECKQLAFLEAQLQST